MPLQTVNNGDSGAVARAKINAAIDAINAMSTTTTSTSTTTSPTTTSSTTSTSTTTQPTTTSSTTTSSTSTTTMPTTTSSTTTSSTTTSSTSTTTYTPPTEYFYQITNCAGGSSYTITTSTFLSSAMVYKLFAPAAPYDTNACWTVTPSGMGGTFSTVMNTYADCLTCATGTTTTSSTTSTTTFPTTTSSTTMP